MSDQVQRDHGGEWTRLKLDCLEGYLNSYVKVLKNTNFSRIYIDAFSGTGEPYQIGGQSNYGRLEGLEFEAPQVEFFHGSVRRALSIPEGFNRFYLIESRKKNVAKLTELKGEPEHAGRDIKIVSGDANTELLRICKRENWRGSRAVLFLDPFGCQVDWTTIEAVAATRAIDMWYLFPSSALNRLLKREGEIPEDWQRCLDRCLGTPTWRDAFFTDIPTIDLFNPHGIERKKTASIKMVEDFFIKRLKETFHSACDTCLPIENMRGSQIFSLLFACGNPKGSVPALKIARHLIEVWAPKRR